MLAITRHGARFACQPSRHLNCDGRYRERRSEASFVVVGTGCVMFEEFVAVIHSIGVTVDEGRAGLDRARRPCSPCCRSSGPAIRDSPGGASASSSPTSATGSSSRCSRAICASASWCMGAAFLFGITTAEGLVEFYDDGHGPLAQLPLWLQAGDLPGRLRPHDVLDPPHLPSAGAVEVSRGASFLRGSRLDLGGALPPGQHLPRQRRDRRGAAAGRHFAERAGVPRARSRSRIRPSCTPT